MSDTNQKIDGFQLPPEGVTDYQPRVGELANLPWVLGKEKRLYPEGVPDSKYKKWRAALPFIPPEGVADYQPKVIMRQSAGEKVQHLMP